MLDAIEETNDREEDEKADEDVKTEEKVETVVREKEKLDMIEDEKNEEDHGAGVANHGGELRLTYTAKVGHPNIIKRLEDTEDA